MRRLLMVLAMAGLAGCFDFDALERGSDMAVPPDDMTASPPDLTSPPPDLKPVSDGGGMTG